MKRLLTHSFRHYFMLSVFMLGISIPVFYFIIQHLLIVKMDDELSEHKAEFYEFGAQIKTKEEVELFKLFNTEFAFSQTGVQPVRDSLFTEYRYDSAEKKEEPFRILRTGVVLHNQPYILEIKESLIPTRELMSIIILVKTGILTSLLIGLIYVNRRITKSVWNPFYKVLHELKTFEIDKSHTLNLPESKIREFHDLNNEISNLVDRIKRSYFVQKEFIENASHELQTPIAICRSKLELLLQMKELTREQAELIESLYEATDSITKLNRNLLLLAKIENRQFIEKQNVNVNQLFEKILETVEDRLSEKLLQVEITKQEDLTLMANRELIEILLNNLVSNAIRHSEPSAKITIGIESRGFKISNTGQPLGHPEKIFERFHRESKASPGHGLGLAIVKMICDVNGYSMTYSFENSRHHFQVKFK